jgi:hypothetical protein
MKQPEMKCPKCGAVQKDFDGLSFSYCGECGYCTHPNSERVQGHEICVICGREIRREMLGRALSQIIEMEGQRVLSVKNPWAYLIIHHDKDVENRKAQTKYRGRILIHASKTSDMYAYQLKWKDSAIQKIFDSLLDNIYDVERTNGHILGSVELYDCIKDSPNLWAEKLPEPYSQHHWLLRDPHPFDVPLPARGMLGLWTYEALPSLGSRV